MTCPYLAHQVSLKCYLSNQDIYLSQTARRNFFSSPVRMPASVFICKKKTDRQWSGFEYFTPHWIAKWIISVFNRVSVWKPRGYIFTQTAPECSGWGGVGGEGGWGGEGGEGNVQCTSDWLGKEVMFWIQRVRNPDSAIPFSYIF